MHVICPWPGPVLTQVLHRRRLPRWRRRAPRLLLLPRRRPRHGGLLHGRLARRRQLHAGGGEAQEGADTADVVLHGAQVAQHGLRDAWGHGAGGTRRVSCRLVKELATRNSRDPLIRYSNSSRARLADGKPAGPTVKCLPSILASGCRGRCGAARLCPAGAGTKPEDTEMGFRWRAIPWPSPAPCAAAAMLSACGSKMGHKQKSTMKHCNVEHPHA